MLLKVFLLYFIKNSFFFGDKKFKFLGTGLLDKDNQAQSIENFKLVIVVYGGLYQSSFITLKDQLSMVYNNVCLDDPQALQIVIVSDVNDEELFQNTTNIFQ